MVLVVNKRRDVMLSSNLTFSFFAEENMLWRARNFNDARLYEKAQNLKTPSCDKLQNIYS